MSKVTGKLQITLPKRVAEACGVKVGDKIELVAAAGRIALIPARAPADPRERLREFDRASERQRDRERVRSLRPAKDRGWNREDSTRVAGLVDTNVLVYRFDPRFPAKQARATELLRRGIQEDSVRVPQQALLEFYAVVTRPLSGGAVLLTPEEARRETEEMLSQFTVVYPTEITLRTALRGAALYRFSWFDAHLWACADELGLDTLWSEDFEHGRLYGRVRVVDPFRKA